VCIAIPSKRTIPELARLAAASYFTVAEQHTQEKAMAQDRMTLRVSDMDRARQAITDVAQGRLAFTVREVLAATHSDGRNRQMKDAAATLLKRAEHSGAVRAGGEGTYVVVSYDDLIDAVYRGSEPARLIA
jgi:hypothetical protein